MELRNSLLDANNYAWKRLFLLLMRSPLSVRSLRLLSNQQLTSHETAECLCWCEKVRRKTGIPLLDAKSSTYQARRAPSKSEVDFAWIREIAILMRKITHGNGYFSCRREVIFIPGASGSSIISSRLRMKRRNASVDAKKFACKQAFRS